MASSVANRRAAGVRARCDSDEKCHSGENINSWSKPQITSLDAAFAVVLGYLRGLRGKLLLDSTWTRLLDCSPTVLNAQVVEASRQGWLNYKAAGSVVEITFRGLLKPQEEVAAYEQD